MSHWESSAGYQGHGLSHPQNRCPSWQGQSTAPQTAARLPRASWDSPPGSSWWLQTQTTSTPTLHDKEKANCLRLSLSGNLKPQCFSKQKLWPSTLDDNLRVIIIRYLEEREKKNQTLKKEKKTPAETFHKMRWNITYIWTSRITNKNPRTKPIFSQLASWLTQCPRKEISMKYIKKILFTVLLGM